ncbi:hypothetical protein A2303_03820 [Candidatus Falkowbacteria bacterium RIFOXYB2_FULL_47_14]|uniref:Uncharacterized protein n=1 Tax=Candidatus Falkowbacteria bacterium RIFOXYA2_FULL_47_19 TaxID=1797994 RepID=A0A1F5SHV0_9BACT|nr:MAG: hypothetical protein A2227_03365 [Candidatus Falkowbacteria bacterium RIFOXYA2_FULL_47_19]OGF37272.1 MAG: hypothetical protein A2468_06660 [Candidatus Falkowbacteria bacterium RIFOXYC2_FULL_46_15]OGF42524.1 MAG: hypothetical protein A2303_03820 [Candidatus Falkowbacteria bacterium RIFOXYB2_FULL_47_14]
MENSIFLNISILLSIAIVLAFIVRLLRQPMIISYILTGIVCGPLFLNLINNQQEFFSVFAQIGVILLLFLVGLNLNPSFFKQVGKIAFFTGVGQVVLTSLFGFAILLYLGFSAYSSIFLAISITFSSTIIILKLLSDKRDLMTVYGRYTLGLMLVQDIIAIGLMIMLPSFSEPERILSAVAGMFLKSIGLLALVYFLSRIILPVFLNSVAQSGEFLLIFTLAWCFAIAGLGDWAGLTLEVGAIIAGISLGSSVYQTEISSRIRPLRDFFIALFFIILGSEMSVGSIKYAVAPGLILSIFVLVGNPIILFFLYRMARFTRRSSFLAGLTAAQVSEFGFVFLFVANQMGYVDNNILSIFTIVALVTIFFSSYMITYNYQIYMALRPFVRKFFGKDGYKEKKTTKERFDVFVFGYHRLGWKICEALKEMGANFAVVDFDPHALEKLQNRRIPHFFGDATDVEFLDELPLSSAKMIISTLPNTEVQNILVKHVRLCNSKALVIASLSHSALLQELYKAGADYIMMPHLVGGQWLADILKNRPWNRVTFEKLCRDQKEEMRLRFTLGHH